ncbi:MAG TPA: TrkH family potassium uptake protein [Vicinamibacteria bacterium]|nr:TrkH family potassium uptake protein [Vicinamibacteria bacterium]
MSTSIRRRRGLNYGGVLFLVGRLLLALAVALILPGILAHFTNREARLSFFISAAVAAVAGISLQRRFDQEGDFQFGRREAFLLVSSAWLVATLAGSLPFVLFFGPSFIVDALFESASGFTTTGASIFVDVESLPPSLLLWRSLTQWIGGMGIIVLGIAILPKLAVGGMELLGAEAPGPMQEKLTPRIAQTAKALWGLYFMLTACEVGLLTLLGLTPLDAVTHAFASMATGGFSTKNASIAAFESAAVEWTVTGFMFLAGANFTLHYQWVRGRFRPIWRDPEFRLYGAIVAIASFLVLVSLRLGGTSEAVLESLRLAAFQVVSIVTTTGFATADYDRWPEVAQTVLWALMFVGGCAGSTGGSVKVVRLLIVLKKIAGDLKRMLQPRAVLPVRLGTRAIPEDVVSSVTTFFVLFLMFFAAGGFLLTTIGVDPRSAFSASAACLGNIGPGFGQVGPTLNYASLPAAGKCLLAILMIVGRLEIYTVLVVFFFRRIA